MKSLMVLVVIGSVATGYGWGLDSVTKTVSKAAETVDEVNNALKAPSQPPPASAPVVPSAAAPSGMQAKEPEPFSYEWNRQRDAAAQEERLRREREERDALHAEQKRIAEENLRREREKAPTQPPPASAQAVPPAAAPSGMQAKEPEPFSNEWYRQREAAAEEERLRRQREERDREEARRAEREEARRAERRAEIGKENQEQVKELKNKCNDLVKKIEDAIAEGNAKIDELKKLYAKELDELDKEMLERSPSFEIQKKYLSFKEEKDSGCFESNDGKGLLEISFRLENFYNRLGSDLNSMKAVLDIYHHVANNVSKSCRDLVDQKNEENKNLLTDGQRGEFLSRNELKQTVFSFKEEASAKTAVEKLLSLRNEIAALVEQTKKEKAERVELIKKLAASDVSTWLPDIEKYPAGEKRDAILAEAVNAKFISGKAQEKDSEGLRAVVKKLYSRDQQIALLNDEKTSVELAFAMIHAVMADAGLRRELLVDKTEWAFDVLRDTITGADMEHTGGELLYLMLLEQEKDLDVLMDVYEMQDKIEFTYEKKSDFDDEGEPKDPDERMWKKYFGDCWGYGRIGLWMLKNCGKDFCKRAEKLAVARRKVAKKQTFLMEDFYLGMPLRDFGVFMKKWDEKNGSISVYFGLSSNEDRRSLYKIYFNAKARYAYLGIKKDELAGLQKFVSEYIPGGDDSVGEMKVGSEVDDDSVKTWWYTDSQKYDCRVKMFKSGGMTVVDISEGGAPALDFSKVKK